MTACSNDDDCTIGNGSITTQTISLATFSGIESSGADTIIISQGDVQKITVTGYSNIISLLKRQVSNNVWKAELEDGCYKNSDLEINITVPNMNYIKQNGSGNIQINDFINQQNMTIDLNGSGNLELNANQGTVNLDIQIAGSGSITGLSYFEDLEDLSITIYGSGSCNLFPLETDNCIIDIEGSGNCNVYVNENLNVFIDGSGIINYKGNPSISQTINGSGSINDAN